VSERTDEAVLLHDLEGGGVNISSGVTGMDRRQRCGLGFFRDIDYAADFRAGSSATSDKRTIETHTVPEEGHPTEADFNQIALSDYPTRRYTVSTRAMCRARRHHMRSKVQGRVVFVPVPPFRRAGDASVPRDNRQLPLGHAWLQGRAHRVVLVRRNISATPHNIDDSGVANELGFHQQWCRVNDCI
jgi:hypothetical protein